MKKTLKAVLASGFALAAAVAFAEKPTVPSSKMSESTQGLYGTEVDDYMSVTDWSNASSDHLFGFMGYDSTYGGINWGLSHSFGPLYTGVYFAGQVDGLKHDSNSTTFEDGSDPISQKDFKSDHDGDFDTSLIFGFGSLGVRTGLHVNVAKNETTDTVTTYKSNIKEQDFEVFPTLDVGYNTKLLGWDAAVAGNFGFRSVVDQSVDIADGDEESTIDSFNVLYIGAGIGLSKAISESLSHEVGVGLETKTTLFPTKTGVTYNALADEYWQTDTYGRSAFGMNLSTSYKVAYRSSDKLSFRFMVNAPLEVKSEKEASSYRVKDTTAYNADYDTSATVSIQPGVHAALVYAVKPSISLNAGVGVTAPKYGFTSYKKNVVNAADGDLVSSTKGTTLFIESSDGYASWSSGATFRLGDKVTFDASYKILANVFGSDMETDFTEGSGTEIWNNVNKALVHNISVLFSVKF